MPKLSSKTTKLLSLLLVTLVFVVLPQVASAQGVGNAVANGVVSLLNTVVVGVFGTFVGWAGAILDYSVGQFVVGFGSLYEKSGLGFSIDNLWSTVRDLFNLTFIFGLVFIGFKMIFNSSDSNARKMLGSLVLAALLVNFSLFITKFVIDFSNIAATQLAGGFMKAPGVYDISAHFVNIMGLSTIFNNTDSLNNLPPGASFGYVIGSLILYLTATFVFAAGGLLLIIRFVVLNIYMVLSPIMFLGWVFPGFSGVSKNYWSGFLSKAFFAPAYILMLYFANQILVNMQGVVTAGNKGIGEALINPKDQLGFITTIPFFMMTSVFLIASLVIANKMGAEGSSTAIAMGKRFAGKTRQVATAIPRKAARATVNAAGEKSTKILNNLQTNKGWAGAIARSNVVDRAARGAATAATGAQYGTGTTNKANRDYKTKTQSRANQTEAENERAEKFKAANTALADTTKSATELEDALTTLSKTIRDMSKAEKEDLTIDELTNKNIATNLTDSDIDNLDKSGKFGTQEIQRIKDARKDGFTAIAAGGSTLAKVDKVTGAVTYDNPSATVIDRRSLLADKGTSEAGKLPVSVFADPNMISHIKTPMLDERIKNGTESADRARIKANIDAYLINPTTPPNHVVMWNKWITDSKYASMLGY